MSQPFDRAGVEPRLEDIVADPMVRLVMRRDGLSEADIWQVVRCGQIRLGARRAAAEDCVCWPSPANAELRCA